jgi:hypothetical protein
MGGMLILFLQEERKLRDRARKYIQRHTDMTVTEIINKISSESDFEPCGLFLSKETKFNLNDRENLLNKIGQTYFSLFNLYLREENGELIIGKIYQDFQNVPIEKVIDIFEENGGLHLHTIRINKGPLLYQVLTRTGNFRSFTEEELRKFLIKQQAI